MPTHPDRSPRRRRRWPAWTLAILLALATLGVADRAAADSPLTSTDFALAYQDDALVAHVSRHGLDARAMEAIVDPAVASDVRAAMINALGWTVRGQDHAERLLVHIARRHGVREAALRPEALSAAEAMALGYMRAMDDYAHLTPIGGRGLVGQMAPAALLERAVEAAPEDFTAALLLALVQAQALLDESWCGVYKTVTGVTEGAPPAAMRPEALEIITGYIDLYASDCANPRPLQGP